MRDEELRALCGSVERLLTAAPGAGRLRVQAGDLSVELEWPRMGGDAPAAPPAPAADRTDAGPDDAGDIGVRHVRAPAVGTFYRAPEPGAPPFVGIGDVISEGQQVGILEAMKLMNPIEADAAGLVVEVLVGDGEPVEYDQPLLAYRVDIHDPDV